MNSATTRTLAGLIAGVLVIATDASQAAVSSYANGQFFSVPPDLQQSIPPNILLNLSVETPMGGAAYNDYDTSSDGCGGRTYAGDVGTCFSTSNSYIGYFDPTKCYSYQGTDDRYISVEGHPVTTDSYQTGQTNEPQYAVDGNSSTFWHSEWYSGTSTLPHWIQVDLGSTLSNVAGIEYVPRPTSTGTHGTIDEYEVYVSSTSGAPSSADLVASGSFYYSSTGETQEVIFTEPKTGRYVTLKAISEINGSTTWASAAEVRVIKDSSPTNYFYPSGDVSGGSCGGKWSGNFLNWATMTAIDEFINTMTGGNRFIDTTDKVIIERARKTDNNSWFPYKNIGSAITPGNVATNTVTPYASSTNELWIYNTAYGFRLATNRTAASDGTSEGFLGNFNVRVEVCNNTQGIESNCTKYSDGSDTWYKPEGLMQRNMQRMRFGIMAYSNDNTQERDGGVLRAPMKFIGPLLPSGETNPDKEYTSDGTYIDNPEGNTAEHGNSGVLNYLNKFHKAGYKSYDPVSELYYECLNYYKHRGPTETFYKDLTDDQKGGFPVYTDETSWADPIQYWCQTNYIIGINDAYPWMDKKLPGTSFSCPQTADDCGEPSNADSDINVTSLTNTVGAFEGFSDLGTHVAYNNPDLALTTRGNSSYIAGLAYYANTTDIRSDLDEKQTVTTFMVDSQEYNSNPNVGHTNPLWLAGKYGGFIDSNDDGEPQQGEWDANDDGEPDNYVLASNPSKMVTALEKAFNVVTAGLKSSQSAASVGINTRSGLGAVYQSTYITSFQDTTASANRVEWIGQLEMAAIDTTGTISAFKWDALEVMESVTDPTTNRTWGSSADATKRYVFTWFDADLDGVVDSGEQSPLTAAAITEDNYSYFDLITVPDKSIAADLESAIDEVGGLVNFIRGDTSDTSKRNRIADFDGDSTTDRLLLGDIVHSQPVSVGKPSENFDLLYDDVSYGEFKVKYKERRSVVYVGANDGLLHAFNAGFFDGTEYVNSGPTGVTQHELGTELWAYAPFNLLPHLKWLQSTAYDHMYYMDGPIKAFDAKVFTADAKHPNGWGTLLVAGMRLGGSAVTIDTGDDGFGGGGTSEANDHEFASAWVLMDITDPEEPPTVLAEIKDPSADFATGMGYSFSEPAVFTIRENDDSPNDWYLVFGNGPNDLSTVSTDQSAKLYIYKLNHSDRGFVSGFSPKVLTTEHTGYVGAVTSVDWNLNYKADTIYFGTNGAGPGAGRFFKIELGEDASPSAWTLTEMINLEAPITVKPTVTVDDAGNRWVYFGSGRLETDADTSLTEQEYLLGIRDGSASAAATGYPIALSDLKDITAIKVYSNGAVEGDTEDGAGTLSALDTVINGSGTYRGWLRRLAITTDNPSERNLSRQSLLGGALVTTTYLPDTDLCTLGTSKLYALYYRTGTAYSDTSGTGSFLGYGTPDAEGTPALESVTISTGIAMPPALHIGEGDTSSDTTVTAVVQDSNAEIHTKSIETAKPLGSGEISWRELATPY